MKMIFKNKKWLIITGIIICGLVYLGMYHYAKRPIPIKPIVVTPDQRPCVINGVLYTRLNETPIEYIKKINLYQDPVRFVIIEWKENNTHGGMFTMRFEDFIKVYSQLQFNKEITYA